MSQVWCGVAIDALDYELIRIGSSPRALGRFADVHHVASPIWRFVSGYLLLQSAEDGGALEIRSHGHHVAGLAPHEDGHGASILFDDPVGAFPDGTAGAGGVAVLCEPGTRCTAAGRTLDLTAAGEWGAVLVHGPAAEKVVNRIALVRSLQRVGGRRG